MVRLKFHDNTIFSEFGHFARVLMDVDLSIPSLDFVMLHKQSGVVTVYVSYENKPEFCNVCYNIGHSMGNCKRLELLEVSSKLTPKQKKQVFVPKENL